jgi:hypothetical protein
MLSKFITSAIAQPADPAVPCPSMEDYCPCVPLQGEDITFACMGAGGQLLQPGTDNKSPLKILGYKPSKAHQWRVKQGKLINNESQLELPLNAHLLNLFAVEELRELEKKHNKKEKELNETVRLPCPDFYDRVASSLTFEGCPPVSGYLSRVTVQALSSRNLQHAPITVLATDTPSLHRSAASKARP